MMDEPTRTFGDVLTELAADKPLTASFLREAQRRRQSTLEQYLSGARLHGFEELLEHLEAAHSVYSGHPQLAKVAFLLKRSKGEFLTALDAALAGFHTVAHDAMRSVMEIEFLLRDFSLDISRLDEWLTADPTAVYNRFRPAVLRQRFANHVGTPVQELPEATDYKGHSMFLHVGPQQNPFGVSGLFEDGVGFATDSCFWEVFEHSWRLLIAIHSLADAVEPGLLRDHNPEDLDRLGDAWVRTQEMQHMWRQMLEFVAEKELDRENDG